MESYKLLLFDLDGTLLRSDKTISAGTLDALQECRKKGMLIGISTSRSGQNVLPFLKEIHPDLLITSGGALASFRDEYIYKAEFSKEETGRMIAAARSVCGMDCEITIDTLDSHYWNYKTDPKESLKMCVEIFEEQKAKQLQALLKDCDCIRFSDGYWYKFTKKNATKENAILEACAFCQIRPEEIMAFGDDYADIGMLELCGRGIAMGNAIDEVKKRADLVIGGNDEDGIANYLHKWGCLTRCP